MIMLSERNKDFSAFVEGVENVITDISGYAKEDEVNGLKKLIANFKVKTDDFYRENRKLNIGVVGQVKAGKSTFLNTLLFEGKEILPKASTPKTATLTKMEYSEKNIIQIEYYSIEEWEVLEENAVVELDDEIYTSAREIINMVKRSGYDPHPYLDKGYEEIEFGTYDDLLSHLNDYVGEDGKYTPIVKAVTLYLNKEEFQGISIVDTPGLNDPIASRTIRTKEFMEICDVVFFLSQSGSFLDKSDWILLSSQLPQKGVKRLALIASKYDGGVRDLLRVPNEDDIFGEDENTADNIPKACRMVKKKLKKRARDKVGEFVKDLEMRGSSQELIEVIQQCSEPILVSSLAYNMIGKPEVEYTKEERNLYAALKPFTEDMSSDLKLLGNVDEVRAVFDDVVREKEQILREKEKSFVPNALEELKNLLHSYLDKNAKRIQVLEENDREQLLEQKEAAENQIGSVRADISVVFGELSAKLESEKADGIREMREAGKDYLELRERTGTKTVYKSYTVSDSRWYNPFSWGKSHTEYYSHEERYSYCVAADVVENLRKYALEAANHVEEVFTEAVQIKEIKRKLLNVIVRDFDMGSEKYDASLFRIMVEETISNIEFPVFHLDISGMIDGIAGKFNGEITSATQKTELSVALSKAISEIYEQLSGKLDSAVRKFKCEMNEISHKIEDNLLNNITQELELLLEQYGNKEKEIARYREYTAILEKELVKLN